MSTNLTTLNHSISVAEAKDLIQRFATLYNNAQNSDCILSKAAMSRSQSFNKAAVMSLLEQDGVIGIRSYFGLYASDAENDNKGKLVLVLCAIDGNGNDLNLAVDYHGPDPLILEDAQLCPPYCPTTSKINYL